MRPVLPAAVAALALAASFSSSAHAQALKTEKDKTLYALGLDIGRSLSMFDLTPEEMEFVKRGLSDSLPGAKAQVNLEEYGPKVRELANERAGAKAKKEQAKGEEFAAKAAKEKGAQKTASGLVYKDLKKGTGPSPKATDTVRVHYKGTLIDGTEFDSSYKRGEPAEFPLNQVIPCWTEGVQKMKKGGKAQLICPPSIAYGDRGTPGIPGGSTLVFEVELLEIKSAAK